MGKTIVLAFGGNAIIKPKERGTFTEQMANIQAASGHLVGLIKAGHRLVITHGNGPQVGNLLLKNELTKDVVPPMPLDVCVSNTQGSLGYGIQQSLGNALRQSGIDLPVISVVTQMVVDPADPAFQHPTKPIGPFYTREEAERLQREKGYSVREDSGRGWRRVVPSPTPVEIVERVGIRALLAAGCIVIASGGGGVPVVRGRDGNLEGIAAVIDKDLAGRRLASDVGADVFMMLTEVPGVALDFGKPTQRYLPALTAADARRYLAEGQFPPGSMGPKMEAACQFVEGGGERAVIVSLESALGGLDGTAGTTITL